VIAAMNNWAYDPSAPVADRWSIIDTSQATLRMGYHVQSIGTSGGSDSYVNVAAVPEPSTTVMALTGLGLAGLFRLRRRRAGA
jgi:MYXO-CTERM domain-containing protein